jgi:hypothetical protein
MLLKRKMSRSAAGPLEGGFDFVFEVFAGFEEAGVGAQGFDFFEGLDTGCDYIN